MKFPNTLFGLWNFELSYRLNRLAKRLNLLNTLLELWIWNSFCYVILNGIAIRLKFWSMLYNLWNFKIFQVISLSYQKVEFFKQANRGLKFWSNSGIFIDKTVNKKVEFVRHAFRAIKLQYISCTSRKAKILIFLYPINF